jgi:hypothetical protein
MNEMTSMKKKVAKINKLWNSMSMDAEKAIKQAILLGDELLKIKEETPHGEWENLFKSELYQFAFGVRQAQKYMLFAKERTLTLQLASDEFSTINNLAKAISEATPEQIENARLVEESRAAELEQRRIEAAKPKPTTVSVQHPEIIEGEFTEQKPEQPKEMEFTVFDQIHELESQNRELEKRGDALEKIFEADDKLAEATKEIGRLREMNTILQTRLNGMMAERNEQIRLIKSLQNKVAKLERERNEQSAD